jgi:hypothetical protein
VRKWKCKVDALLWNSTAYLSGKSIFSAVAGHTGVFSCCGTRVVGLGLTVGSGEHLTA